MLFMRNRSLAAVALIVALAAGWTSVAAAYHPAKLRGTNTIVSQGSGRQTLEGGGLTYGSLAPGGIVRFVDLSPKHDGKFTVTAQVPATTQGAAAQSVADQAGQAGRHVGLQAEGQPPECESQPRLQRRGLEVPARRSTGHPS